MAMTTTQPSTAVVRTSAEKMTSLKTLFESKKAAIQAVLPKHLTAERVVKVTLSAISRNPELLACSQESVFFAVIQAAELGLEFGSVLGHAYLVPFKNKNTRRLEATFIPGYRGLIALSRRSGQIESIEAHVVKEKDHFKVRFGTEPVIEHEPYLGDEPGKTVAAYMVAKLRDGGKQVEVMTRAQLLAVKNRSAAANAGPWVTDEDEMFRKTVVKRGWKYLPMSLEMQKAAAADDAAERASEGDFAGIVDMMPVEDAEAIEPPPEPPAKGLRDKLAAKAAEAETETREPGDD